VIYLEKINYKLINILLLVATIFFISISIETYKNIFLILLDIILPIFLSFFISYSLYPCTHFMTRKISYNTSCFLIITICLFLAFILIYTSIPIITKEITSLSSDINFFISKLSFLKTDLKEELYSLISYQNGISLINTGTSFITKFIIVFILSIYFLFNMNQIKTYLKKHELLLKIDNDLHNYYKGFYLIILIEIFEYLIIYFIIGHPYFLLLSLLSGLTSVIPLIGAFITNFIALISAFSIGIPLFIKTAIVMILLPILNSYIIEPRVYKKTLKVSLISIIISCFIFGSLFNLIGIIFAIPFFLIIKNLYTFFFSNKDKI